MDAINRAYDRGEVFEFETAEEAERFAAGSWKEIGTHDAEAKAFYSERGLDYTREKALQDEYEDVKNMLEFIEGAHDYKKMYHLTKLQEHLSYI